MTDQVYSVASQAAPASQKTDIQGAESPSQGLPQPSSSLALSSVSTNIQDTQSSQQGVQAPRVSGYAPTYVQFAPSDGAGESGEFASAKNESAVAPLCVSPDKKEHPVLPLDEPCASPTRYSASNGYATPLSARSASSTASVTASGTSTPTGDKKGGHQFRS